MINTYIHQSVLPVEAINALDIKSGHWYIDATFGRGGHTRSILNLGGKVIAFDFDMTAIEFGKVEFSDQIESKNLILIRENFDQIESTLSKLKSEHQINSISGVLFDFGTSADQLTADERGFSFNQPEMPLDMRMDDRLGVKASDLLKVLSEKQLSQVFQEYGGEEQGKKIAKSIVRVRQKNPHQLDKVGSLVEIILSAKTGKRGRIHHATKVFQALRIVVNDELDNIKKALPQSLNIVKEGGRIVTISFHEGEDRIAKELFKKWEHQSLGKQLTSKPISPSEEEVEKNPRSRSAKMRVFEKTQKNN